MNNHLIGIAVDASACPNPGRVEYRGMLLPSRKVIFNTVIGYSTINVGEYLAIVQALCWCEDHNEHLTIWSDSKIAINWVQKKFTNSKIKSCPDAAELFEQARGYVDKMNYVHHIKWWNKRERGEENPADYGRK